VTVLVDVLTGLVESGLEARPFCRSQVAVIVAKAISLSGDAPFFLFKRLILAWANLVLSDALIDAALLIVHALSDRVMGVMCQTDAWGGSQNQRPEGAGESERSETMLHNNPPCQRI